MKSEHENNTAFNPIPHRTIINYKKIYVLVCNINTDTFLDTLQLLLNDNTLF